MGLKLETVVPWGRSLDEYVRMFDLSPADLQRSILDCAGGPASFNAELAQQGGRVISCDPVYQFSVTEIRQRIQDTYPVIMEGVRANYDAYVWHDLKSPEYLCDVRLNAMNRFLADFEPGLAQRRYQVAALPNLPFGDRQFDLALCGHFLFSYSEQFSVDFHVSAVQGLCRVADEARIFPILTLAGDPSPALDPVTESLRQAGYSFQVQTVPYEFQVGGNQMLRIFCSLSG
jgi:hypothetical protein